MSNFFLPFFALFLKFFLLCCKVTQKSRIIYTKSEKNIKKGGKFPAL